MIRIIEIDEYYIDPRLLIDVANEIRNGAIVIFPTDSVYALGCSLSNKKGIDRILKITCKKEKHSKLALICKNIKDLSQFTLPFSTNIYKTMNRFLPGPYTFVLKADKSVRKYFDNSKSEIGVRVPSHPVLQELFKYLEEPLITTSLNNHEDKIQAYFVDPGTIAEEYQHSVDILIDAGQGELEVSTVLDCTSGEIELIRQGAGALD